ncbi:hypothetical protein NLG97_g10256 [Lecanicillium saksenae]|uniref:Uncharacterized protein n=1 Tax=Lecanicillium saksenae TaxID=468837 RepID=A0ACC1QHM9_9HYPO|nr:hypothetical protein NLG97_g10256 [Lecanicillium saksenae]
MFTSVTRYFGLKNAPPFDGRLEVDCRYRKVTEDALVVIMDGGDELPIPMGQLLNVRGDGKCYLDMMGVAGAYGDSFVRNVYVTYDYEEMTIEVSMAKYTTETDIVPIA